MEHKIEIEGAFINGERYCDGPDTIRVKGNVPKYIKEYVARFEDSYSPINLVEI